MIDNQNTSRRTILLLATAVIVIWGYIAFRIESVSSANKTISTTPQTDRAESESAILFTGGNTYVADFSDPFTIEQPIVDSSSKTASGPTSQLASQRLRDVPEISLLGTIGNTALVTTQDSIAILRNAGDSISNIFLSDVDEGFINVSADDSVITVKMRAGSTSSFFLSKPE